MIKNAQKESETNIIKINDQFHSIFENREKMAEDKNKTNETPGHKRY